MRILGLDYGSVTVGVAVSDELLLTAQGLEVIRRKEENKLRKTLRRIEEIVGEYGVGRIVLGYPKALNNAILEPARKAEEFAKALERRTGLPVALWDERFSTAGAHRAMIEGNVSWRRRKESVDMVAAAWILQGYLDFLNMRGDGERAEES